MVWRTLRLDDNDNRFVVAECASENEARRIVDEFRTRGHKQVYWVECCAEDGASSRLRLNESVEGDAAERGSLGEPASA